MAVTTPTAAPSRAPSASARVQSPATQQRPDIQGMRAVAVGSVLLGHAGLLGLHGGYVGVDVFFVISGYLITGILAREVLSTGGVSIAGFYARRARRILPAASVTLLAVLALAALAYREADLHRVVLGVVAAALFGENVHLALADTDYFAVNSFVSPVQHFWSLAVEEQFYLVWPLLMLCVAHLTIARGPSDRARGARRLQRLREITVRRAAAVVLLLTLVSFAWSVHATSSSPQTAYFSTFTRGWELGLGAFLALVATDLARVRAPVRAACSWIGLLLIAYACIAFDERTPFPGHHAAVPTIGAALVLFGGLSSPRLGAHRLLSIRPLRWLGDISYSLYLWHWPVLVIAPAWFGRELGWPARCALVALSVVLGWLSYRWVEVPTRAGGWLVRPRWRSLALWPACVALVLVPAFATDRLTAADAGSAVASTGTAAGSGDPQAMPVTDATLRRDVAQAAALARSGAALPETTVPALVDLFGDIDMGPAGCSAPTKEATSHRLCTTGDPAGAETIVIWGDSHAYQWLDTISRLAARSGVKVVGFSKASCMPVDTLEWYRGGTYPQCLAYQRWVLDRIAELRPSRVILSGGLSARVAEEGARAPMSDPASIPVFEAGAGRILERLRTLTPKVSILSDGTLLPTDSERCLGSRAATFATCARPQNATIAARNAAWSRAAAAHRADFIDLTGYLCADGLCPIVIGNVIVYRDSNHLTRTFTSVLSPILAERLGLEHS